MPNRHARVEQRSAHDSLQWPTCRQREQNWGARHMETNTYGLVERRMTRVVLSAVFSRPLRTTYFLLARALKEVQMISPFRRFAIPNYGLAFGPSQLHFMCRCLDETREVEGRVAEIGCDNGRTTIYLCAYLFDSGNDKRYVAMDTFSGFVREDVDFEKERRGKKAPFADQFRNNKKKWYDLTMKANNITRVESIQGDVNMYDLTSLGPLSFVLLDVDLYRPMRKALPELYRALSPGGIMIADDCNPENSWWDGAYYAYTEFMQSIGQPAEIVHGKLGVIRKLK